MDALELLKEDHQKVKELFEEAEGTEDQTAKQQIFERLERNWKPTPRSKKLFFTQLWRITKS